MKNAERRNAKIEMETFGGCLADPDSLIYNFDLRLASKLSESLEAPPPTDEDAIEFDELNWWNAKKWFIAEDILLNKVSWCSLSVIYPRLSIKL